MTTQVKKTYRSLNPRMLCDELQGLLEKQGVIAVETESQTYALPSGATQTRITLDLKTQGQEQKECGSVHILGSPGDESRMLLNIDETALPAQNLSAFQEDLDFVLGAWEVKW